MNDTVRAVAIGFLHGLVRRQNQTMATTTTTEKLLELLAGGKTPSPAEFKSLVSAVDSQNVLAKVFLLEGTPFVFESSPMKYVIFREQVADRFGVGSQDICIVGSAKLGFSPSPVKYGKPFKEESDVDVVVISEELFHLPFPCVSRRLTPSLSASFHAKKFLLKNQQLSLDIRPSTA